LLGHLATVFYIESDEILFTIILKKNPKQIHKWVCPSSHNK